MYHRQLYIPGEIGANYLHDLQWTVTPCSWKEAPSAVPQHSPHAPSNAVGSCEARLPALERFSLTDSIRQKEQCDQIYG